MVVIFFISVLSSLLYAVSEAILRIDNKGVENFGAFCRRKYKMYGIIYFSWLATRRLSVLVTTLSCSCLVKRIIFVCVSIL